MDGLCLGILPRRKDARSAVHTIDAAGRFGYSFRSKNGQLDHTGAGRKSCINLKVDQKYSTVDDVNSMFTDFCRDLLGSYMIHAWMVIILL